MTRKELEALGFVFYDHRGPNESAYTHPLFFKYCIYIPHKDTLIDVLKKIYEQGVSVGRENGRLEIQQELKNLLNIRDEESL